MTEQPQESQVPAQPHAAPTGDAGKRARKFPLTLHPTGQYCKKIRGKLYYFGKNKQEALRLYHQQASSLHAGQGKPAVPAVSLTLKALCNLYLDYQSRQVTIGEIK